MKEIVPSIQINSLKIISPDGKSITFRENRKPFNLSREELENLKRCDGTRLIIDHQFGRTIIG